MGWIVLGKANCDTEQTTSAQTPKINPLTNPNFGFQPSRDSIQAHSKQLGATLTKVIQKTTATSMLIVVAVIHLETL